jgi:hypothetical protein
MHDPVGIRVVARVDRRDYGKLLASGAVVYVLTGGAGNADHRARL